MPERDTRRSGQQELDEFHEEPEYAEGPAAGDRDWRDQTGDVDGGASSGAEQVKWRRLAWAGLIVLVLGVTWMLAIASINLNRSNDFASELVALLKTGQKQRQAGQQGRQAGIKAELRKRREAVRTQQAQTRALKAQRQSAVGGLARGKAQTSQSIAESALAGAEARRADAQAALAQAQAARAHHTQTTLSEIEASLGRQQDLQRQLIDSIDQLRKAIEQLPSK